tara:strand:- start:613 stop:1536 length:924 start_codon:yes stop_codon:yes gene_type:complete
MKITRKQFRQMIAEALKGVKYASKSPDAEGYNFSKDIPDNAEELYGKSVTSVVSDIESIDQFFKTSIIDINMLILPDRVYKGLITGIANYFNYDLTDIFTTSIDSSIFNKMLYGLSAKVRGLGSELSQVRAELDPTAFNIIVQQKDKLTASAFMFDLSWVTHDLLGHALNFQGTNPLLNIADQVLNLFTIGKVNLDNFAIGSEFEQQARVSDRGMIGTSSVDDDIIKSFQQDFENENFTSGVATFDLGASIIGYYVIKGKFPQTMYNEIASGKIDEKAINKLEKELFDRIKSLEGQTGFVNFGDMKK